MTGPTECLKNYNREYDYNEYAYAPCFMLLSCTTRNTRSECAYTGRSGRHWTWLGFLEFPFSCLDYCLGRLAYWKSRSGIAFTACVVIRAYTAQVTFTQTMCLLFCVTLLYTPFYIIALQGRFVGVALLPCRLSGNFLHSCIDYSSLGGMK
jgi:hypothetical protein